MNFTLTPMDAASITDVEMAFSTDRLLPPWDTIPEAYRNGNIYTRLAEAIFDGRPLPNGTLQLNPGFTPELLNRLVRAHLQSFGPKHEHKIAGVGFMIANAATLHETS